MDKFVINFLCFIVSLGIATIIVLWPFCLILFCILSGGIWRSVLLFLIGLIFIAVTVYTFTRIMRE